MKKQLLTVLTVAFTGAAFAQLPVSTSPQNRKAVLEEFTGIYCGYCPDGHQRANALAAANPGNVVLINVHSGGYANVANGEPDLKTSVGNVIDPMSGMGILGYPAGDINRTNFGAAYAQNTVSPYGMAQNRNTWSVTATQTIMTQSSYVNVALQGSVNVATRVLTVQVQVYYTGNSPASTNSLNVFLLESKIIGPQHNYGTPYYNLSNYNPDGTYNHNHALRASLTGNFGMTIPTTTTGTSFSTTLTYTIPATYGAINKTNPCLLGNLELAAFITETDRPTVTGANGPVFLTGFANSLDVTPTNLVANNEICASLAGSFRFTNLGSSTATNVVFSYAVNGGAPAQLTWTGNVAPFTEALTINIPNFSLTPVAINTLVIDVVSVNGGTDQVSGNNTQTKTIPQSTLMANSINMQMDFTQDQWGSEDSWKVYDDATNAIISQDGPFTDLGAVGTQLHTKVFTINPSTCYRLVVSDAYGDGTNSGYGVGGYILKSGGVAMITSNGQYGTGETKRYQSVSNPVGISTAVKNVSAVNIFPNPTAGVTNLSVDLTQNESVNVVVMNNMGQVVFTTSGNFNAGANNISINTENWAAGVYFVNVSTANGSVKQKLTVAK